MKVIYPIACGIDVHKSFIVAVICDSTTLKPTYTKKRFSTFHKDLIKFRDWLLEHGCDNVCMESTGKYWIPVFNILEGHISNVVLTNPKWVKAVKGKKDDNKDAKWICDLFKLGLVQGSFIPEKQIRILRELTRNLFKVTNMRSSEKNRFQNALTVDNCNIDQVFSDVFGKSASAIINLILADEPFTLQDISTSLHGHCKATAEEVSDAIIGFSLEHVQKQRITLIQAHMEYLNSMILNFQSLIDSIVSPYDPYVTLLSSIPGVKRQSAITIISEIGIDMSQFGSHHRLASWAGLTPGSNESAGKKKSVKISRAGVYLKPCLLQVAHAAIKDNKNLYYANKFNKIAKRRGKKRAYIAIARKILVAIYHMIDTGEFFNPRDLADTETTIKKRIQYTKNNLRNDINSLLNSGLSQEDLSILINSILPDNPQLST